MVVSEIRRSPVEVGSLCQFLQGFVHSRWLFGISSINFSNGISTFSLGNTSSMGSIFHCYVSLPEGMYALNIRG